MTGVTTYDDRVDTLIIGGGFGGAFAARALEKLTGGRVQRTMLVAPDNFLLFSPLLPEAASGTIEPRHAVIPLRELLDRTELVLGTVVSLDAAASRAVIAHDDGHRSDVEYRTVVIAAGAEPATLPIPGLAEHAVGFKTLADAIWLRNKVLHQLEVASATADRLRRREQLTFTFVGGGYAGVEALAELESLTRDALHDYPALRIEDFRWVLVEAQDRLLPGLPLRLARDVETVLRSRGVEIHLGTRLASAEGGVITLSTDAVAPYRSEAIVWATGQRPAFPPALGLQRDQRGAIVVDNHLRVAGHTRVFALGDVAAVPKPGGGLAPGTAQHALRQARAAARNVAAVLHGTRTRRYRYRTRGTAVTLGKHQGAVDIRGLVVNGPLAWWMGRSYHLLMVPGLARRLRLISDWTIALLFRRDTAQLGQLGHPRPLTARSDGS